MEKEQLKQEIIDTFKKLFKVGLPIVLTIVGTLAMVSGEVDDSPGLGGIGLIIIGISFYLNYKNTK